MKTTREIDKELGLEGYFDEIRAGVSEKEAKKNALDNYEVVIYTNSRGVIKARNISGEYE